MQTESSAGHTPGPWMPSRYDHSSPWIVVSEIGEWVCKVSANNSWAHQSQETEEANARLIAAAPDLLAACVEIVESGRDCPKYIREMAGEAIAKARGDGGGA